jgi:hypothetical protein
MEQHRTAKHRFEVTVTISVLDSLVGIATRLGWKVRGSNPARGNVFRTHPYRPQGPPSLR